MKYDKEVELKLLLSEEEYHIIKNHFTQTKDPIGQENFYFDTPTHALEANKITLRIRKEADEYILCAKIKKRANNGIANSEEHTVVLRKAEYEAVAGAPDTILHYCSREVQGIVEEANSRRETLGLLGSIKNVRICLDGLMGYLFELDMACFPDGSIRYELEVEGILEEDYEALMKGLNEIGVSGQLASGGKYNRFVEIVRKSKVDI